MAVDQTSSRNTTFVLTVSQAKPSSSGDTFNIASTESLVYDSVSMIEILQPYSDNIIHLADDTATPANIKSAIADIINNNACKLFVFHYSGPATGIGANETPRLCLANNQSLTDQEIWNSLKSAKCKIMCIFACGNMSSVEANRHQPNMFRRFGEFAATDNADIDLTAWSACSDNDAAEIVKLSSSATSQSGIRVSDTLPPHKGEWNSNFTEVKRIADEEHVPLVAYGTSTGCTYCNGFATEVLRNDQFKEWQQSSQYYFAYVKVIMGNWTSGEGRAFEEYFHLGNLPRMAASWTKPDDTLVKTSTSGASKKANEAIEWWSSQFKEYSGEASSYSYLPAVDYPGHRFIKLIRSAFSSTMAYSQLWSKISTKKEWSYTEAQTATNNKIIKKYICTPTKLALNNELSELKAFTLADSVDGWDWSLQPSAGTGLFEHSELGIEHRLDASSRFVPGEWYIYGKVYQQDASSGTRKLVSTVHQKELVEYADANKIPLIVYVTGNGADTKIEQTVLRDYSWLKYFRESGCLLATIHYQQANDNSAESYIFGDKVKTWPYFRVWHNGKELGKNQCITNGNVTLTREWFDNILQSYSPSQGNRCKVTWLA